MSITTATYSARISAERQDWSLGLILLGGACTGTSGILMRLAETGPVATAAWRMAIAALILSAALPVARRGAIRWSGYGILLLAGFCFAVDMAFYHWALVLTPVAHATLIVNLAPLVALSAGFLLFGESLGKMKLIGLAASMGGAFLMTAMRADAAGTLLGNGLAFMGMLGYAFYLIVVKKATRQHGPLTIMVWSSASAAAMLFAVAIASGEQIMPTTLSGWAVVIAMGVVAHVIGQGLIAYGMRSAPVGLASVLLLIQPVVAAIGAWVLFNESLAPLEVAGALLVLAGLAIASRSRGDARRMPLAEAQ
jgi:drug/metabolite transporter (DMT)-like permease